MTVVQVLTLLVMPPLIATLLPDLWYAAPAAKPQRAQPGSDTRDLSEAS
jgi:hypothetical protein